MSQLPRALLEYANEPPSGARLGPVSTPDASVSCVNVDHGASAVDGRRPSHQLVAAIAAAAAVNTTARAIRTRGRAVAVTALAGVPVATPALTPDSPPAP